MDGQHLKTIGALQLDYYIKAINTVVKKEEVSEIIVFTDDPNHPDIEALRSEFNCVIQSEDWSSDFFGIMNCEFQVISNSTFSWWAAFLSAGLDSKKVWAPDPFWIRSMHDDEDEIVPKGWNRLESIWYEK